MSSDERAKVKSAIPESSGKILHVTLVKIYHAHPNSTSWTDIGQEGALTLVMDEVKGGLWFRMIDLKVRAMCLCLDYVGQDSADVISALLMKTGR